MLGSRNPGTHYAQRWSISIKTLYSCTWSEKQNLESEIDYVLMIDAKTEPNLVRMVLQPQTRFPSSELVWAYTTACSSGTVQVNLQDYQEFRTWKLLDA
jgi:hypothetical protein